MNTKLNCVFCKCACAGSLYLSFLLPISRSKKRSVNDINNTVTISKWYHFTILAEYFFCAQNIFFKYIFHYRLFSYYIVCGDDVCDAEDGEECETCPADCGSCPLEPWQMGLISAFLAIFLFIIIVIIVVSFLF